MPDFNIFPKNCDDGGGDRLCLETWRFFQSQTQERLPVDLLVEPKNPSRDLHKTALMLKGRNAALDKDFNFIAAYLEDNGLRIPCSRGCSACCKQAIVANPFEAALIGVYISERPELRSLFIGRYASWEAETKSIREDFMDWAYRRYAEDLDDGRFKYTDFRAPCPFLEDDVCRIYPVRPYCCRSYLATSESCRTPTDPSERAGFAGVDVGAYTDAKKKNRLLLETIWGYFGIDGEKARGKLLPDLIHKFLNDDLENYLAYCISNE